MATFPVLKTGAVAQYPSSRRVQASTRVLRFLDGTEQRFEELGEPIRSWVIRLTNVSDEELYAVEAFFVSQQGSHGEFAFVDPWDGAEYPNCSFANDHLAIEFREEGRGAATLVIRNNQVS